jgi:hypothetical protein
VEKWGKPPLIDRNSCPSHNGPSLALPRLVSRRRVCRKRALISVSLAKPSNNPDWELVYRDPLECAPTPLKISNLTLNGEPLWGAPDLVYRNRTTGELVIVERKASDKPIPVNGWPNLRAQLWAYSHIDNFKSAPTISLIGEVWDMVEGRLTRRAVLRWAQADKEFDAENMELFSLYGGVRNA